MDWDFFNEDGNPQEVQAAKSARKPQWAMAGTGEPATRQGVLELIRDMPVPICHGEKGHRAGKCLVRMPDGTIEDETPDKLPAPEARYTRWM